MTQREAPILLQNGDVYSTAFQFFSHINASVDPRTGTYSANIEMMTGEGNLLRGPNFPFRLAYSALSTVNEGFGEGWHLGMTQMDVDAQMLTLSSGDTHKVEGFLPDVTARFPDRKLDSFSLMATSNELRTAVVEHITGVIEHLELHGNLLRPVRIINAAGDSIHLTWERALNGLVCLTRVADDGGQAMLDIEYLGDTAVVATFHFGHADMPVQFDITGPTLTRVSIPISADLNTEPTPEEEWADWRFDYQVENGLRLLREVAFPDGTTEDVVYDREALRLPEGAPFAFMPAVVERRQRPTTSPGTILQESRYSYDNHGYNNFFGYPLVSNWETRNDQLLHLVGAGNFLYGSTEEQRDGIGTLCTISREYDQFHLERDEVTTRGNVVQRVKTEFGELPNTPFLGQPKNFQLPHRITSTRFDSSKPEITQVTYVENTYDDFGNILSRYDSVTDTTEISEYYPPEGEMSGDELLCPPDPIGIVRRLKSRRTEPGARGGPVRSTHYRYCGVPARETGMAWLRGREYYVQACTETTRTREDGNERTLVHSEQRFIEDQGDQHGNLFMELRTQDGLTEIREFSYETDRENGTVSKTTLHTTHDQVVTRHTDTLHLLSGLAKSSEDAHGNRAEFAYDAMGRRTSELIAADDPDYMVETRWTYQLSASVRWMQRVGITGLTHRVWMDEKGRVIRRQEPLADGTLVTVNEMAYDALGQLVRETNSDRLLDERDIHVETRFSYDDWGEQSREESSSGAAIVSETELAVIPDTGETVSRTMQWRTWGTGSRTGWRSAYTDGAGRQVREERGMWSPEGEPIVDSTIRWDYDGLGRCVTMTETFDLQDASNPTGQRTVEKVTRQTWDDYDRLATTTLPDNSVVKRAYAPGQEDELLAGIAVVPAGSTLEIPLGTQEWDGLGRVTVAQAGSLTTRLAYIPRQLSADNKTMPDQSTITMTYDHRLREVLLESRLIDAKTGLDSGMLLTAYDNRIGLPIHVSAPDGEMAISLDYLGRMTGQTIEMAGDIERHYEAAVSLGGLPLRKRGTDDVEQIFDYDEEGRLLSITDPEILIELAYDPLSRLERRTCTSRRDQRSVIQDFQYDELGRVATMTLQHVGPAPLWRQLRLTWRPDDKLVARAWHGEDNALLRAETMDYDDRGRLVEHTVDAAAPEDHPQDEMGQPYVRQRFRHDSIDNLLEVETTRRDGQINVTTYGYDDEDRDRLTSVSNSLAGYPGYDVPLALRYDDNGNLVDDGQGRQLEWDGAGRLVSVSLSDETFVEYAHGPNNRISRMTVNGVPSFRYYEDGTIAFEVGTEGRRFIRAAGSIVAETRISGAIRDVLLLGTDPQGSVVTESVVGRTLHGAT